MLQFIVARFYSRLRESVDVFVKCFCLLQHKKVFPRGRFCKDGGQNSCYISESLAPLSLLFFILILTVIRLTVINQRFGIAASTVYLCQGATVQILLGPFRSLHDFIYMILLYIFFIYTWQWWKYIQEFSE